MSLIPVRQSGGMGLTTTRKLSRALIYFILTAGALIGMVPVLWTLSSSFKDSAHIFTLQVHWIPNPIQWHNYVDLFVRLPMLQFIRNTLLIAISNVVSGILMASIAAYAFARLQAPFKHVLFLLVISTMLLPTEV